MLTPSIIGVALSLVVSRFATMSRLDGDRAFYPTVMIVVASYYVLFAVIGGTSATVMAEAAMAAMFLFVATWGFRRGLWLVAAALAAHGLFDMLHGFVISDPGVPIWWPGFCAAYDLTAAGILGLSLRRGPRRTGPRTSDIVR